MDIFVGSLPFKMKERELQEIFEKYGEVSSVKIIIDHETRQNKGFGFVKMPDEQQALHAISELNGVEIDGRPLVVNESKFRKEPGRTGGGDSRPERSGPRPQSSGPRPQGSGPRSDSGSSRPDSGYSRPDSSRSDSSRSDSSRSDNSSFKKGSGDYQGRTFDRNSGSGSQGGGYNSSGGDFNWGGGSPKGPARKGGDSRKDGGFDRGKGGKGSFDRNKGKKGGNRWDWDDDED